jgi:hypothetical protein
MLPTQGYGTGGITTQGYGSWGFAAFLTGIRKIHIRIYTDAIRVLKYRQKVE